MSTFSQWLKKEISDERYYSGGLRPVERLSVLREVAAKLKAMKRNPGLCLTVDDTVHVTVDDLMHGTFVTSRGLPQEGIVFVCQKHGIQPFHEIRHAPAGIELDCGCFFAVNRDTGAIKRNT
jgi:hypothetical protein